MIIGVVVMIIVIKYYRHPLFLLNISGVVCCIKTLDNLSSYFCMVSLLIF